MNKKKISKKWKQFTAERELVKKMSDKQWTQLDLLEDQKRAAVEDGKVCQDKEQK